VYGKNGAGAQKLIIAFQNSPNGLQCTFSMPFAREDGVGPIRKRSIIDGTPIEILEFNEVSSSCQVKRSDKDVKS